MEYLFRNSMSFFLLFISISANAKTVRYELTATRQTVNFTGSDAPFALTINGSIPAPTLEFTEGDEAEIWVKNSIPDEELSLHWHGLLLPPEMDGVPNLTTASILPNQSHLFKFKIRQHGTYWYHSHTHVQEQKGLFGAIVIHSKKEMIQVDKEIVVVISDWTDENPESILKNLRKDGDYYLYKKNTIRSYWGALKAHAFKTHLVNEWQRMGGMDFSDVGYDTFLINGKKESQLLTTHPEQRIRIRLVNASASSYFYVSLGNVPLRVISADGVDIQPIEAKEILMGMAETYDILYQATQHKNLELKATSQDGLGSASGWIGAGEKVPSPIKKSPDLYMAMEHSMMDHSTHENADHSKMDHSPHAGMNPLKVNFDDLKVFNSVETLTVDDLKAQTPVLLPRDVPATEIKFVLDGDMRRYIWHLNGKAIFQDRNIMVNKGDVVRLTFENNSMMHHPMHLHGHFFRVKNQYGDFSPLKHTVDVPPMGSRTIEFLADEPGEWMLHCHNLFHMKTGMARVLKYQGYEPAAEILALQKRDHHMQDHIYGFGRLEAGTNHTQGRFKLSQTWNELDAKIETRKDDEWKFEGDLFYRRWAGSFLNFTFGATSNENILRGVAGVGYLLPLLIESQVLIDQKGLFRIDLGKKFQWTRLIYSEVEYIYRQELSLNSETLISLMYSNNWSWSAGLKYTGYSFGAGLQFQF